MNIAHVLSSFRVGGQEKMAVELAAGQRRRGHEVHAVSIYPDADGPLGDEFARHGVVVHRLPKRGPTLWPVSGK